MQHAPGASLTEWRSAIVTFGSLTLILYGKLNRLSYQGLSLPPEMAWFSPSNVSNLTCWTIFQLGSWCWIPEQEESDSSSLYLFKRRHTFIIVSVLFIANNCAVFEKTIEKKNRRYQFKKLSQTLSYRCGYAIHNSFLKVQFSRLIYFTNSVCMRVQNQVFII